MSLRAAILLSLAPLLGAAAAPAAPLAIVKITLHQFEGGPDLASDYVFAPGDTVFLTFHVQGYKVSENAAVALLWRLEAVDSTGTALMAPVQKEIKTEVSAEDKAWMPKVVQSVPVPPLTQPGTFRILVSVEDLLAKTSAKAEVPFQVGGRRVEPSETLTVRNFRFLRAEDSVVPLDPPVYHRGDMLWARFDIVGYRLGEKNRIQVVYGLSVLGPTGKAVYSEPRAAVEDTANFYPKRYLPGALSLNLEKAQPGDYTIALTVKDDAGSQTFESRYGFKIE